MSRNPIVSIKSNVSTVIVRIKVEFAYRLENEHDQETEVVISEDEFKYPRDFNINIPLNIHYGSYLHDKGDHLNAILAKGLNEIAGNAMAIIKKDYHAHFDVVRFTIVSVSDSKKDKEQKQEVVAEWKVK